MKSPSSRTYILPTGYGISFAGVCIFLIAVAFASTNNAVYLLCFVMASLAVQSLVITNKNIEKLEVNSIEVSDYFADEIGYAKASIHNPLLTDLENITFEFEKKNPIQILKLRPGERQQVQIPLSAATPGKHLCPKLKISSDYPFYFARSWKMFQSESAFFIYPPRRGQNAFSANAFLLHDSEAETQDEFKGHRDYRDNDSPRAIDWKVTSRLQKMTVKEYDSQGAKKIWLRWQDVPAEFAQDRAAQLSLWIDLADKMNFDYGLVLPHRTIEFGNSPNHKTLCLRALL